jgi:hypothetical protein
VSTKNRQGASDLERSILDVINHEHPTTVSQLVTLVRATTDRPEQEIVDRILLLQDQGRIVLHDQLPLTLTFKDYVLSVHAYWYLLIVVFAAATATLVLANLEQVPVIGTLVTYARYVFGSIFVLFLPGYSFIKALFPVKEIDNVERAALSIGMSLAITAINALVLNYTPWGIATTPITLGLLGITVTLSTAALIREQAALSRKD